MFYQIVDDREELESLQVSVESLKAEKMEIENELNILNGKRMEILEKTGNDAVVVGVEKSEVELATQSGSKRETAEVKDFFVETGNDAKVGLQKAVKADTQIEMEAVKATATDYVVEKTEMSEDNFQVDLATLKAEQVDPIMDEGNRDESMESFFVGKTNNSRSIENEPEVEKAADVGSKQSSLLETLKSENASLVHDVKILRREKSDMHQFHSQVYIIIQSFSSQTVSYTAFPNLMLIGKKEILMKVLETLRNEFEVELAAKDARILQVGPHPPVCLILMHLHHHFNSSTIILSCASLPRIRAKASADQLSFTVNWMRRPGYYNNHIKKISDIYMQLF